MITLPLYLWVILLQTVALGAAAVEEIFLSVYGYVLIDFSMSKKQKN